MFNKNLVKKDKKIRKQILKAYKHNRLYKSIIYNNTCNNKTRYIAKLFLNNTNVNSSYIRARNRCFITGRARSVFSKINISRIMLKYLNKSNMLAGLRKV